ncbi:MAG: ABC transporter ATP-binding protein [Acidimicrobiales bacterium]
MLQIEGLSVRLGERQVLDQVAFEVPTGRVVGLLGPNGAGKTTTMRILLGIVSPDSGSVRLDGADALGGDRNRWGYMPQERGLYVKMRAKDHLVYMARLRGLSRSEASDRADQLLGSLSLSDRADDKLETLSGGMQQRVQLAGALVHDPDILVLDEPFSGLDPNAVDELTEVIRNQATRGRTVLFSSHQLDLVEDICETIVLINAGRVVLDGDLHRLKSESGERVLRIGMDAADHGWADRLDGATVLQRDANETLFQLDPGIDPLTVLDSARASGTVHDFGLELPRLSQLFRQAVAA